MKKILYILIQWTWGILQTLLGLILFLINIKNEHIFYHGAIITRIKGKTSISLGMFAFVGLDLQMDKRVENKIPDDEIEKRTLVHEYGHTIQSIIFGPLYLLIIGIPSSIWAMTFNNKNNTISYYSFYTEKWANVLGEKVTKEKAMEEAII